MAFGRRPIVAAAATEPPPLQEVPMPTPRPREASPPGRQQAGLTLELEERTPVARTSAYLKCGSLTGSC